MTHGFRFACAFFLILAFTSPVLALDAGMAPATRKILPSTPIPSEKAISLKAAKNEWEAFQIVLKNATAVENINVSLSDLKKTGGTETISATQAVLYREHYLNVTNESPGGLTLHERVKGLYPDPLIPFVDPYKEGKVPVGAPFALGADNIATVFVDWHIPLDAIPGDYQATATVSAQGQTDVVLTVNLTVWDFEIPQTRSIGTAFGFGEGNIRHYHGGPTSETPVDVTPIIDRYYIAMHEHRMDPTDINGSLSITFDTEGKMNPIDWTAYDATIGPWLEGTRFPDGIGVARFNVNRFEPGRGTGSMTEDQYAQAAAAFAEHLEEKGWWERAYVYAVDEPWLNGGDETFQAIAHDVDLLNRYTDLWKGHVLVTGPFEQQIAGKIGIWCPVTPMYEDWFWKGEAAKAGRAKYAERFAVGEKLWFYVCNANMPPYAGYDIDTAIGYEPRIVKWGTWYEGATGFLYWRVSYWTDNDPWNVYLNVPGFGEVFARNGDGLLLYPGNHDGDDPGKGSPSDVSIDGPIVSYRMKQIRDGFEDWEMFILCEKNGGKDYCRAQVERAYTRFGDFMYEKCSAEGFYCPERQPWTIDENVLLDARNNIGAKVQYLLHKDQYPDPETPVVDGDTDAEEDLDQIEISETSDNTSVPSDKKSDDNGCASSGSTGAWAWLLLAALAVRRKLYS